MKLQNFGARKTGTALLYSKTHFSCQPLHFGSSKDSFVPSLSTVVQRFADSLVSKKFPASQVLVSSPNETAVVYSGTVSKTSSLKVDAQTQFFIGSITKVFTSVVILQLMEEGALSLNDKLEKYLPPEMLKGIGNASTATIKEVLQHTSGIPEQEDKKVMNFLVELEKNPHVYQDSTPYLKGAEGVTPKEKGKYFYSNVNYALLGEVIEKVTQKKLDAVFRERIFQKAGMQHTDFGITEPSKTLASTYMLNGEELADMSQLTSSFHGSSSAGGIVSTAEDISKFMHALFETKQLLSQKTLNLMKKTAQQIGPDCGYGLGLVKHNKNGALAFGHNGTTIGSQSEAWYFPESKTALIALTNLSSMGSEEAPNLGEALEQIMPSFLPFITA